MNAHNPKISFVIPAYNEEQYIGICLRSIIEEIARGPHEAEIIVVNNASTDNTAGAASAFPGVRVITEPQKGITHARQRGLREATGEWIANIDSDITIRHGWLRRVLGVIARDKKIVCVSGPHIYSELPILSRIAVWIYWVIFAKPTYWFTGYMVQGGNFVARKSALIDIGGFDTSIAFYGEDTNIARRLHKVGNVKFLLSCFNYASARRIKGEGIIRTGYLYVTNFFSEVLFKRPAHGTYNDFR